MNKQRQLYKITSTMWEREKDVFYWKANVVDYTGKKHVIRVKAERKIQQHNSRFITKEEEVRVNNAMALAIDKLRAELLYPLEAYPTKKDEV